MIDRVSQQKYYDEYARTSQAKRGPVDASAFNESLEKQGVIYEKGEQKKQEKVSAPSNGDAPEGSARMDTGVKTEVSRRGYGEAVRERQRAQFIEQIRRIAQKAVAFLKSVWDRVWNDPAPEGEPDGEGDVPALAELGDGTQVEEAGGIAGVPAIPGSEPPKADDQGLSISQIRRLLRYGSQEEIEDFISAHGTRHPARNTELLTQYDRKGILVDLDHSERELILHGNKKEIRL